MSPEAGGRWRIPRPWPAHRHWGEATLAAFMVAVVTGVGLAIVYDPVEPLVSVGTLLLGNPAATYLRNLHYWSTQALIGFTLLHVWEHVRRAGERRLRPGAWLRVSASLPIVFALAWTGFVLKGDAEAQQAQRVVFATLETVPGIGSLLARGGLGGPERVHLVYVHHVATLTLILWMTAIEHGRLPWPRMAALWTVGLPLALLSLVVGPTLHDGRSAVVKGPWFFIGMQEALHWSPWPGVVVLLACLPPLLLVLLRGLTAGGRRRAVVTALGMLAAYAGLTIVGWAFRSENWTWSADAWRHQPPALSWGFVLRPVPPEIANGVAPRVMGRPEGCLACHAGVTGLSKAHDPAVLGCASCHGGQVFAATEDRAHTGMRLVPGNLGDAAVSCGGACHPSIVTRVERSIMTSLAGIVTVNRRTWGEDPGDARAADIRRIGHTPADSHLRGLCASCHLGAPKIEPGPVDETSRGGGCTACHVQYSDAASGELARVRRERASGVTPVPARIHPDVSIRMTGMACFGCHSRSGRISLSYEGWHESDRPAPAGATTRALADGRIVVAVAPDAHHLKGMACIDCHTAREVMGDGQRHGRKSEQAQVRCEDCHRGEGLLTRAMADLDEEARRLVVSRPLAPAGSRLVATATGDTFVHAYVGEDGIGRLRRKSDGDLLELRPPAPPCRAPAHARVSCIGCHTAWAPRCTNCHTRFDPRGTGYDLLVDREVAGEWQEAGSNFVPAPPTLAVRRTGAGEDRVEPAIPGMIATFDAGRPGDPVFRRLYARAFSHTVTRAGRSCESCHNDPVALGYGEGTLSLVPGEPGRASWRFVPRHASTKPDGLPDDAWIAPGQPPRGPVSTRDDVRPLTDAEQQRVLNVGACLTCHPADSPVMRASLQDFAALERRMTSRCRRTIL